jgi:hypothetical protein
MDIEDLKASIACDSSIEEAAEFLCRADSANDFARKCEELGLRPKAQGKRPPTETSAQRRLSGI